MVPSSKNSSTDGSGPRALVWTLLRTIFDIRVVSFHLIWTVPQNLLRKLASRIIELTTYLYETGIVECCASCLSEAEIQLRLKRTFWRFYWRLNTLWIWGMWISLNYHHIASIWYVKVSISRTKSSSPKHLSAIWAFSITRPRCDHNTVKEVTLGRRRERFFALNMNKYIYIDGYIYYIGYI